MAVRTMPPSTLTSSVTTFLWRVRFCPSGPDRCLRACPSNATRTGAKTLWSEIKSGSRTRSRRSTLIQSASANSISACGSTRVTETMFPFSLGVNFSWFLRLRQLITRRPPRTSSYQSSSVLMESRTSSRQSRASCGSSKRGTRRRKSGPSVILWVARWAWWCSCG